MLQLNNCSLDVKQKSRTRRLFASKIIIVIVTTTLFFVTFHWICKKSNTTGASGETRPAYHSGAPGFTSRFQLNSFCSICILLSGVLSTSVCLFSSFCFWQLCCLYFHLPFLITPLISSSFSYRCTSKYLQPSININVKVYVLYL